MEFRVADTFTGSLAKLTLTGEEQKAGKTTAFELQLNPAQPGINSTAWKRRRTKTSGPSASVGACGRSSTRRLPIPCCATSVARYVTAEPAASPVFSGVADKQLLDYGVPAEWLNDVKEGTDDDALVKVADHLLAEAG